MSVWGYCDVMVWYLCEVIVMSQCENCVRLLPYHCVRIVRAYCDVPVWELYEEIVMSRCETWVRSSLWGHWDQCDVSIWGHWDLIPWPLHKVCVRSLLFSRSNQIRVVCLSKIILENHHNYTTSDLKRNSSFKNVFIITRRPTRSGSVRRGSVS